MAAQENPTSTRAPVDVLAVMASIWNRGLDEANVYEFEKARVALAELIDRAEKALIALGQCEESLERECGDGLSIAQLVANGEAEEYAELAEALARVKGGAQ